MGTAIDDIRFLANRLKGLSELAEKLSTEEALDNQIKELKSSSEMLRSEVSGLVEHKEKVLSECSEKVRYAEDEVKKLYAEANKALADSKTEAMSIVAKAKTEAEELIRSKDRELQEFEVKLKAKRAEMYELAAETDAVNTRFNTAKTQLKQLREKL